MATGLRAAAFAAALALAATQAASAAELALKRVLLSTGGVGLYDYEANVEGDATVELKAPLDQVDDILKSLVVFDDRGGVGGLDLAGPQPLSEIFRTLPFSQDDLQSTPQLLTALRGAEVEVTGARALKGRIVAVTEEKAGKEGAETALHRVAVMTDSGLEQFILEQADSVRFADPALRADVAKALAAVAADSERGARTLRLSSKGAGARTLHVAYLAAAPMWKVSYRLVLDANPQAETAALQGWATLENISGQDWSGVELTLVTGRPVSYRQALYRAYRVQRPEAPVFAGAALAPETDNGAAPSPLAEAAQEAGAPRAFAMKSAQRPAAPTLSLAAEAASRQNGETQVAFRLPHAVSVANGRTLSLPIVDAAAPAARLAIFDPQVDRRHPLAAAELTNATGSALPPGIVTIYERGDAGVTYVGDSQLSATPEGEKRLLAYALDEKTTVNEDDSDHASLVRMRAAKGMLTLDELTRRAATYRVKATEPRKLVVLAAKMNGGAVTEPHSGVTEADGRYRATFDVKPGDAQSFVLRQERTQTRLVALADLGDDALATYAKSGEIDAETRASLQKLGQLRAAEDEAERALQAARQRADDTVADQTRVKDLLGAVAAGSDLAKRYLAKLDADETQLETERAAIANRTQARDSARRAVQDFVAAP